MSIYNSSISNSIYNNQSKQIKNLQKNESHYIFYFFTNFRPKREFLLIKVTGREWGRYDVLSKRSYGTDKFYWVVQLLDTKENFWDMDYDYILYIPDKLDIIEYINFVEKNIINVQ